MFYSETLLQKTGPLAKVWLAANVERKLTKGDYLKQNITKDVHNIVNDEQAPLALRLTSQLLLGVVRIYSRKARYLLDDCNEALLKIKLAFRPGNVDLPSAQSHIANPNAINMQETITELDLFAPVPDLDDLIFGPMPTLGGDGQTELNWGTSQVLPDTLDDSIGASQALPLEEDDLDLDLGLDTTAPSVEIGRRAATPRREELLLDDDLQLDLGLDDTTIAGDANLLGQDNDADMLGLGTDSGKEGTLNSVPARDRSGSPLSDLGADQAAELERTFQLNLEEEAEEEQEDETQVQAQQRVKRRKVLQNDLNTELDRDEIRAQQEDRSKILRQPSFLPRDPMLLALLKMQRSGGFVSSILGDQQPRGWAPKIRGILSLEVVRKAGDLKRKRGEVAPLSSRATSQAADEDVAQQDDEPLQFNDEDGFAPLPQDDGEVTLGLPPASPGLGAFDETTHALVAPADSGPVSLATKHTVHMLRERFNATSDGEPPSPNTRKAQSVLFTDLCPAGRTTRHDATKLFFETLVLATKDAVKVEQKAEDGLGAPFRIRAKRGLWGDWAEMGVGPSQQEVEAGEDIAV